jgi:hypothetical protein
MALLQTRQRLRQFNIAAGRARKRQGLQLMRFSIALRSRRALAGDNIPALTDLRITLMGQSAFRRRQAPREPIGT